MLKTNTFPSYSQRPGEKCRLRLTRFCLALMGLFWIGCAAQPETPTEIGSRRQLLVDDALIERTGGKVELRLNSPAEREVVSPMTNPGRGVIPDTTPCFGTATATACTTGQPPGRDRQGALPVGLPGREPGRNPLGEAGAGAWWSSRARKRNNIILSGQVSNTFVPFKDTNPSAKPGERYKALAALSDPTGLYAFASPTGSLAEDERCSGDHPGGKFRFPERGLLGRSAAALPGLLPGNAWSQRRNSPPGTAVGTRPQRAGPGRDDLHL